MCLRTLSITFSGVFHPLQVRERAPARLAFGVGGRQTAWANMHGKVVARVLRL